MKVFLLSCLLGWLVTGVVTLGYHEDVGIPEATRIRRQETPISRIAGGMPSDSIKHPYLAGVLITLMTGQMSVCGGTLLSSNRVLTAGQCWYDGYNRGRKMEVILDQDRLFWGYRRQLQSIVVHQDFNPFTPENDLAMLTLQYSVSFSSYIKPALLPSLSDVNNTYVGVAAKVIGYGKTSDTSPVGPTQVYHEVTVPVISYSDCYWNLGSSISNKVICTSGINGWGPCGGDTGGPLVIRNYNNGSDLLIGVTSILSPMGCQNGFASGYMRVTSYLTWILSNL